jgi:hypothetical protein
MRMLGSVAAFSLNVVLPIAAIEQDATILLRPNGAPEAKGDQLPTSPL